MKLWLDAQLSPEIASWIVRNFSVEAVPVRDVGLRDASDRQIFEAAKLAAVVLITKDSNFSDLISRFGSPPQIIWLRCGNTSNEMLRRVLGNTLNNALALLRSGESLVEISDKE